MVSLSLLWEIEKKVAFGSKESVASLMEGKKKHVKDTSVYLFFQKTLLIIFAFMMLCGLGHTL